MGTGAIIGNIDVAQVTLYVFWIFFAGLIWYLRKEDRREGYPLEDDETGEFSKDPWLFMAAPKTFHLPFGQGVVTAPDYKREERAFAAERRDNFGGAPLIPTGDPMLSGVGPGSRAERSDTPDLDAAGGPRLAPTRAAPEFAVAEGSPDPVGLRVVGCDRKVAGHVTEMWIDKAECMLRYLEVRIGDGDAAETVLLPINFCTMQGGADRHFFVRAITAEQFRGVPRLASADQITRLEEEKVVAYYGAGTLYATPDRQEAIF